MRIRAIRAINFKSLVDFGMGLAKFNCLIGLNSSGKSTVLQFFDFIARQMRGDIEDWLQTRKWQPADLNSKLTSRRNIFMSVAIETTDGSLAGWKADFNRHLLRCTQEQVIWGNNTLLKVEDGHCTIRHHPQDSEDSKPVVSGEISFEYQGSILSQIKQSQLPDQLLQLKHFISRIKSLDLLAPELMRQRTRAADGSIGIGGERLSAFIHELGAQKRQRLIERLGKAYPQLRKVLTRSLKGGWKKLEVTEQYADRFLTTEARHLNDGLLRLLAILAQLDGDDRVLLLDEIENGIYPELVEYLIDTLVNAREQILVTTHSPLILNYLEDDVAIRGVHYLYKTAEGATQTVPFFEIPSMREKLTAIACELGVPMLPKPKSGTWLICALKDPPYQHCAALEQASGNDASPNALKGRLEALVEEGVSRASLNARVENGLIRLDAITDMMSVDRFKERLDAVLSRVRLSPV